MMMAERGAEEKWGPLVPVGLSAGGILFPYGAEMKPGSLVRLEFVMQAVPIHPIVTLAEILRHEDSDASWGTELPYRLAAKFIDMDPEDADRIAKRVFDVQLMFLRRTHQDDYLFRPHSKDESPEKKGK